MIGDKFLLVTFQVIIYVLYTLHHFMEVDIVIGKEESWGNIDMGYALLDQIKVYISNSKMYPCSIRFGINLRWECAGCSYVF